MTPGSIRSCAAPTASVATSGSPAAAPSFSVMPQGSERDGSTSTSAAAYHGTSSSRLELPDDARAAPQLGLERPRADEDELPRNALHRLDEHVEPLLALEPADVEEDAAVQPEALAQRIAVRPLRLDALGEDAEVDRVRRDEDPLGRRAELLAGRRATHVPGTRKPVARDSARRRTRHPELLREHRDALLSTQSNDARALATSACQNAGWFQPPTITTSGRKLRNSRRRPRVSITQREPRRRLRPGQHDVAKRELLAVDAVAPARVVLGEERDAELDVRLRRERVEERDPERRRDLRHDQQPHQPRRQTATTSDAPSSAPGSITTPSSVTSVVGARAGDGRRAPQDRRPPPQAEHVQPAKRAMAPRLEPPLPVQLDALEALAQQRREVVRRVLGLVERVRRRRARPLDVRRRDDVHAVRTQHARRLAHRRARIPHVLERLERADDVEARVAELERRHVHRAKRRPRAGVALRARTRSSPRSTSTPTTLAATSARYAVP